VRLDVSANKALRAVHSVISPLLETVARPFLEARCNLCGGPILKRTSRPRCLGCLSAPTHRGVGAVLQANGLTAESTVYELSHHGALFAFLKRKVGPRLVTSEYLGEGTRGQVIHGVRSEDVQDLTFASESFDFVTSTEVFEHVPDDLAGMREVYRVLKWGGAFVFTVPLDMNMTTRVRARSNHGVIEHLLPPEYHGDTLKGGGTSLVFRDYGRDIAERHAATGFLGTIEIVDDPASAVSSLPVCLFRKVAR